MVRRYVGEAEEPVRVPVWVGDLVSFRRWADADDFPEDARVWYLKGEVWVDMSKEEIFTHVLVKTEISAVLRTLVRAERTGLFLQDGALLANVAADMASRPDATFVSNAARRDRVRLIEGKTAGRFVELEGSPDMVLEVVSPSSVRKDTSVLRQAYWEAGVLEYWLVDARREPLTFTLFRYAARGYVPVRPRDGWLKSAVFGRAFRLVQRTDHFGNPDYTLEIQ